MRDAAQRPERTTGAIYSKAGDVEPGQRFRSLNTGETYVRLATSYTVRVSPGHILALDPADWSATTIDRRVPVEMIPG